MRKPELLKSNAFIVFCIKKKKSQPFKRKRLMKTRTATLQTRDAAWQTRKTKTRPISSRIPRRGRDFNRRAPTMHQCRTAHASLQSRWPSGRRRSSDITKWDSGELGSVWNFYLLLLLTHEPYFDMEILWNMYVYASIMGLFCHLTRGFGSFFHFPASSCSLRYRK